MFTVFDLETTGFSSATDDVIQFAYVTFDDNNMFLKAESLYFFYEGMSWSEQAYEVHQIPQSYLRQHADKFEENLIKMWTVLSGANVIGHNALAFDAPFAGSWLRRFGLSNLQFGIIQDTMLALRPLNGGHKAKLSKLCELCGITEDNINNFMNMWFPNEAEHHAHNAAWDVTATAIITLLGMSKGYISFSDVSKAADTLAEVDMSLLDSHDTTTTSTPIIEFPEEEKVYFNLIEEDGSTTRRQFISNREKFKDSDVTGSLEFPKELKFVIDDVYEVELVEGVTARLQTSSLGDVFTVATPMATLQTPTLGLRTFAKGL